MTFRVKRNETETVLEVAGAIRIHSSSQFRTALLDLLRNPANRHPILRLNPGFFHNRIVCGDTGNP